MHPERGNDPAPARAKAGAGERDETARNLRLGRSSGLIGLVVTNLANPFYGQLAIGVSETAEKLGVGVVLVNTGENREREMRLLNDLISRRVDDMIVAPASDDHRHLAQWPGTSAAPSPNRPPDTASTRVKCQRNRPGVLVSVSSPLLVRAPAPRHAGCRRRPARPTATRSGSRFPEQHVTVHPAAGRHVVPAHHRRVPPAMSGSPSWRPG